MSLQTPIQNHHRYCHQPDPDRIYSVGDVRVCPHGKIQVGYEVPGTIPPYFRDLNPVFNPILWRRAKRLIAEGLPEHTRYRDLVPSVMTAFAKPGNRKEQEQDEHH